MRITELKNVSVSARAVPVVGNGQGELFDIAFTDKVTGDVIWLRINRETRDAFVRELTGGIVLAGGDLPKL